MDYKTNNLILCEMLWNINSIKGKDKIDVIMENMKRLHNYSEWHLSQINDQLNTKFYPLYYKKWQNVKRNKTLFTANYKIFLEKDFIVTFNNKCHVDFPSNDSLCEKNIVSNDKKGAVLDYHTKKVLQRQKEGV